MLLLLAKVFGESEFVSFHISCENVHFWESHHSRLIIH